MAARRKKEVIASPEEVLITLTGIMRGELCDQTTRKGADGEEVTASLPPKVAERARAAELLGKRYGLFTEKSEPAADKSALAEQIEAALAKLMEAAT